MRYAIEETEAYKILARRAAEQEARYAAACAARPENPERPTSRPSTGLLALLWRAIGGVLPPRASRLPARFRAAGLR